MVFTITQNQYEISTIYEIVKSDHRLALDLETIRKISKNRVFLETKISNPESLNYGINTGFGSLCNVRISENQLASLQRNLVLSHACGMGDTVPLKIVRLMFLLKILNLSKGASGVSLALVEHMIDVYNADIMPVIYTQGSLGASGDLAPLAHLGLTLIGSGKSYYKGDIVSTEMALKQSSINPINLQAKEGLALLNGTQFSLAYGIHILCQTKQLFDMGIKICVMSSEAYMCDIAPFHRLLHEIRPHPGQLLVAKTMYSLMEDSDFRTIIKSSVQDPYSFRCIPQVHGASYQVIEHAEEIITIELNSVTDNPMIFDEEDMILSGGNFHAQPLALVLDYLAIGLAELGSISERRTYQLINGDRGLPPFLITNAGLNSGYMIAQYTAASIVSQNKQYCTPASVDSIISSKGQEDHVSMAANAATKCHKILENLKSIFAIEWNVAAQALDMRRPNKASVEIENLHTILRAKVPHLDADRLLHDDLMNARQIIEEIVA
jgi:histidine ammonia-lyase